MQTQAIVTLHLYTESCARRVHVASIKSIMVFPCVFASDIRSSFALQHACVTQQSINVGFMCCMQCKSMFSLTSVYLQPSKSHSLCIHTVLDPLLVRTHHASGTCSCLCASAEAAPTVPQCRFHVPFLCSCNGSSVIQSLTPTTIFKKLSTCKLLCCAC